MKAARRGRTAGRACETKTAAPAGGARVARLETMPGVEGPPRSAGFRLSARRLRFGGVPARSSFVRIVEFDAVGLNRVAGQRTELPGRLRALDGVVDRRWGVYPPGASRIPPSRRPRAFGCDPASRGPVPPGSIRWRSTLAGRSLRRTTLNPPGSGTTPSPRRRPRRRPRRTAIPGSLNRPAFNSSISYASAFRLCWASFNHTGTACRMPFGVTGGRSPRRPARRLVDRMDLHALGLDVPGERQLLLQVPEPVGVGLDHDAVIDVVGVVATVDQLPRVPFGVRGVSDEHQHVDVASLVWRRPGPSSRRTPRVVSAARRARSSVGRGSSRATVSRCVRASEGPGAATGARFRSSVSGVSDVPVTTCLVAACWPCRAPCRVGAPSVLNRPDPTPARRACRTRGASTIGLAVPGVTVHPI